MANLEKKSELANDSNQSEEKEVIYTIKYGNSRSLLKLGELEVPCYIINDEKRTRVLSQRGISNLLGISTGGGEFQKFINRLPIESEIDARLKLEFQNPLNIRTTGNSVIKGYRAEMLIDLCLAIKRSAIVSDQRAGEINNKRYILADIIINSCAKTGIIALVDEAVGYDREAEEGKDSLQKFFSEFLRHDAAKWVKTFPDSFFFNIYKMKGWTWKITNKHPVVVGLIIRDLVYERLAPGLLEQFDKLNPKNENGNRIYKNHQFIKEDYRDMLPEHFSKIDMLAKLADYDWDKFTEMMDKVMPKYK